jgi:EAL and modified HD-GYP domain-containing signal transduction protein
VPFADYIKCDPRGARDFGGMRQFISQRRNTPTGMVAERVETEADLQCALGHGFNYFQGYFFGQPSTRTVSDIPGRRFEYLRLMQALQDPDLSIAHVEELIKSDASLCYRILRTVNSAAFGQRVAVSSIRHALVLMGCDTIRRWVSLWLLAGVSEHAPEELITMATVRARCCELLCHRLGWDEVADGFLLGLCSMLDALLDCPMGSVLEHLPLSDDLVAALSGEDTPSRRILDCVVAYERGDWPSCVMRARRAGINLTLLPAAYGEALLWADAFRRTVA